MPYIKRDKRNNMTEHIDRLCQEICDKGDLNYAICEIVGRLILKAPKISYTSMSETIDAVHDAECELRRRLLTPYEVQKMIDNGDVPSFNEVLDKMKERVYGNKS